ncbi:hypothetical protein D3C72_698030 [compost metagenome]
MDFDHPGVVEQAFGPIHRDVGDIVEGEAEQLALLRHHADHPETHTADADQLAQRIACTEQLDTQLMAEHHIGRRTTVTGHGQELAQTQRHAPGLRQLMAATENVAAPAQLTELDIPAARNDRHRRLDMRQAPQGVGITDGQWPYAAEQTAEAAGLGLARAHGDDPRTKLREVLQHIAAHAFAYGREQRHGGYPDRYPEQGQQAAQGSTGQRRAGQPETILPAHQCAPGGRSAATGSSAEARAAGSQANSSAVPSASSTALARAHQGA